MYLLTTDNSFSSWKQIIVIVISEFLERHSKAERTKAPAYSWALVILQLHKTNKSTERDFFFYKPFGYNSTVWAQSNETQGLTFSTTMYTSCLCWQTPAIFGTRKPTQRWLECCIQSFTASNANCRRIASCAKIQSHITHTPSRLAYLLLKLPPHAFSWEKMTLERKAPDRVYRHIVEKQKLHTMLQAKKLN